MNETIICVDDDAPVLRAIDRDLGPWLSQQNIKLQTIDSPSKCLSYLEEHADEVLLVVSDLRMPEMKGSQLLQFIADHYPDIGLILLTAFSDMEDITKAASTQLQGLILKPWDKTKLELELNRALCRVRERRDEKKFKRQIENQLTAAGEFQSKFFSTATPESPFYTFQASSAAAPGIFVSGDHYQSLQLPDGRLAVFVSDVSGHGVKPAMAATVFKMSLDNLKSRILSAEYSIEDFVNRLNKELCKRFSAVLDILISCSAVLIDPSTMTMRLSGGGNPPICIVRKHELIMLPLQAPALGFHETVMYAAEEFELHEHDRIVIMTDGVYDRGASHSVPWTLLEEMFLQADAHKDFISQIHRLLGAEDLLDELKGSTFSREDLTIVSIKMHSKHAFRN
ncbi:SpoIIE family protein phosphatase [Spirochaeta dissipatitropha]